MFDPRTIPDINLAKKKALQMAEQVKKEQEERAGKFQVYKKELVEYYCNYFGIIINNKLERGIRGREQLQYRDVADRLYTEYNFIGSDDECFDIMEEVICKLGNAYIDKGYDFQVDKYRSNAVCTNDFYRIRVNF